MIRQANVYDTEAIMVMLNHYREASPLLFHKDSTEDRAREILAHVFAGRGVIFLYEQDNKLVGMLLAIKSPNIWDKDVLVMNELAYWIEPDYRGGRGGYRLIKSYQQYCDELKTTNEIQAYTISKMSTSPDLKYDRFGFTKIEEMWGVQ
jgi:N-acetylglutamate synthase-like GNAT family acetyltransferase